MPERVLRFFLYLFYPLTLLYRFLFFLDRLLKKENYELKDAVVISVGNLSTEKNKKTPFILYLIDFFDRHYPAYRSIVLSRGYGGKMSEQGMQVETFNSTEDCGDEPFLIKFNRPEAEVIIGKKRYHAYRKFQKESSAAKVIFLDDGFQHHELARNFDIVLIDSDKGLGNGFTIPLGHLREPLSGLKRADMVIFTRCKPENEGKRKELKKEIYRIKKELPILESHLKAECLLNSKQEKHDLEELANKEIYAFSGIGNPYSFERMLVQYMPAKVHFKHFLDHHSFSEKDIENIIKESNGYHWIICTEKDFVKIKDFRIEGLEKIFYLKI
ncbi:MAG: tetraacyldisaccharide 4'-kinase, partial [Leptospiraceae bacterium]|nr:tetraacyldisaccharide 4'-kinase [Leptospiraceae bacterium]